MLPDTHVLARQAGRIAFGAVLALGAMVLVWCALEEAHGLLEWGPPFDAKQIVAITWIAAFGMAYVTRSIVRSFVRDAGHPGVLAASLAVPAVGLALILPLTIHLPFALWLGGTSAFDDWCRLSIPITALPHLVLALLAAVRGCQLAAGPSAISRSAIFWITVTVSCVPFVVFVLPPILVGVTGLPILVLLKHMEVIATRERGIRPALPYAIVHRD